MKIILELYGASREFSEKDYLKFNLKEKSSINDLRNEIFMIIIKLQKIKKLELFHQ